MARINTNIPSLMAQTDLRKANASLSTSLERLSSGLQINRGADDPAGLIASESLRSELAGVTQAIDNSQRAANVIATAEGALSEVASLLLNIKSLAVEAANTGGVSQAEIDANQAEINSAVQSITRIANVTNFAGLNLLDGSLDYQLSGVAASQISTAHVYNAQLNDRPNIPVDVEIIQAAEQAVLAWPNSQLSAATTLEIAGVNGVETRQFTAGTTSDTILQAINDVSAATGVTARYINSANHASGIELVSTGYGSDAFVSVQALADGGSFDVLDSGGNSVIRTEGVDVGATVNGSYTVGSGLDLSLNSTYLTLDLTLDPAIADTVGQTTNFDITGGGALFQLGPHVSMNEQRSFGIQSIAATRLGSSEIGWLSQIATGGEYSLVAGEADNAAKIVDEAIAQIATLRGRMGAFERNTLETNINSLGVTMENLSAADSTIRDADFAAETANLTRAQVLTSAATSVLSIANSQPQQVLQLLQ